MRTVDPAVVDNQVNIQNLDDAFLLQREFVARDKNQMLHELQNPF